MALVATLICLIVVQHFLVATLFFPVATLFLPISSFFLPIVGHILILVVWSWLLWCLASSERLGAPFFLIGGGLSLQFSSYSPFNLCSDFWDTFSYVSSFSFSFPSSSSSINPSLTVSSSPTKLLYPYQQTLSMCSQGLCKGTLLPIINFRAT